MVSSFAPTTKGLLPDPDAQKPDMGRPFRIDDLKEPRLVSWAAKAEGIDERVESARAQGYDPGPVVDGSRKTPHGALLQWRLTLPQPDAHDGLIPFLIEWGVCEHPAPSAAQGCTLAAMSATHPNPAAVLQTLQALGIQLEVKKETDPTLIAMLETPKGKVELS